MNSFKKLLTGVLFALTVIAVGCTLTLTSGLNFRLTRGLMAPANCGQYQTYFDWNISHEEILSLTNFEETYKTLDGNESLLKDCSEIIYSATSTKGQLYRQEDGKEEVKSLKFGTGSAAGSLSLVLTKNIDAIGFYAEAYQHAKDQSDKTLTVNGTVTKSLGHTYSYDLNNSDQRFFIEFDSPTNEITIAATNATNNRFHIYSIGFYSKHSFPDAELPSGGDTSEETSQSSSQSQEQSSSSTPASQEITFVAGTDTGDTSVTKGGITITMSTMSRSDNYRTYASTDMVVSSTVGNITKIEVTCTANGTSNYGPGKFSATGYTYSGKVGTWTGSSTEVTLSAASQVRMTQIVVTIA